MQTIPAQTPIADAHQYLTQSGQDNLVVTDENNADAPILGIIIPRDLELAEQYGFRAAPVAQHLRCNIETIAPTISRAALRHRLNHENIEYFIRVEAGRPVEVLARSQLIDSVFEPTATDFPAPQTQLQTATWQLLEYLAATAEARGWQLYIVGGVVRDLWLAAHTDRQFQFKDIDLVVEGADAAAAQAGVALAQAIQEQYPTARLTVHGTFQTAALAWDNDPELGNLGVDIATARTEYYAYPAANPTVAASTIEQDLYRRDFTINAMALSLTAPHRGQVLDFFGGVQDLRSRQIRILHPNSFIEDPTRIFRAVRFATRLGFRLDRHSEALVREAIASGVYMRTLAQHPKAPALTTRLKAELQTIVQVPYSPAALELLTQLKAWHCLHPNLHLTPTQRQALQKLKRGLRRLDPAGSWPAWQLALQLILAQLPSAAAAQVARNLQLPDRVCEQVGQFAAIAAALQPILQPENSPSAIVAALKPQPTAVLVLLLTQLPRCQRRLLWRYLSQWSTLQPPLNGHDLAQLGYPRGPQYRVMLNALLDATLDGNINNREAAVAYLAEAYPLNGFKS